MGAKKGRAIVALGVYNAKGNVLVFIFVAPKPKLSLKNIYNGIRIPTAQNANPSSSIHRGAAPREATAVPGLDARETFNRDLGPGGRNIIREGKILFQARVTFRPRSIF